MSATRTLMMAAGLAALALPLAASAQSWSGSDQYRGWPGDQQSYAAPNGQSWGRYDRRDGGDRQTYGGDYGRGDYGGANQYGDGRDERPNPPSWFTGFPEFQGIRTHLKQEIGEGRRDGWLSADQAQRLVTWYEAIQRDEYREFREHGWALPDHERDAFRHRLNELDARLDRARDRGEDYGDGD